MIIFQLDRIAEVIASRRKTMENKNPFLGKVGGRRSMLEISKPRSKKSCMCNRHDKRVPGGAMMVRSSDSETVSHLLDVFLFLLERSLGLSSLRPSACRTLLSHR